MIDFCFRPTASRLVPSTPQPTPTCPQAIRAGAVREDVVKIDQCLNEKMSEKLSEPSVENFCCHESTIGRLLCHQLWVQLEKKCIILDRERIAHWNVFSIIMFVKLLLVVQMKSGGLGGGHLEKCYSFELQTAGNCSSVQGDQLSALDGTTKNCAFRKNLKK